eukprot:gene4827-5075_t
MWDEFAEKAKQEEAKLQKQQEEEARVCGQQLAPGSRPVGVAGMAGDWLVSPSFEQCVFVFVRMSMNR